MGKNSKIIIIQWKDNIQTDKNKDTQICATDMAIIWL